MSLQQAYEKWVKTFWMVDGIGDPSSLPMHRINERIKAWEEYVAIRDGRATT